MVFTELPKKAIFEAARTAVNQTEWAKHSNVYLERHAQASKRIDELEAAKRERLDKTKTNEGSIKNFVTRPLVLTELDEKFWLAVIDTAEVGRDGGMTFKFRNGTEIAV